MKEQIKQELLELAENVSRESVESVFKILEIYIKDTENKIDDAVLPFLPLAEDYILELVDKIDGNKNE